VELNAQNLDSQILRVILTSDFAVNMPPLTRDFGCSDRRKYTDRVPLEINPFSTLVRCTRREGISQRGNSYLSPTEIATFDLVCYLVDEDKQSNLCVSFDLSNTSERLEARASSSITIAPLDALKYEQPEPQTRLMTLSGEFICDWPYYDRNRRTEKARDWLASRRNRVEMKDEFGDWVDVRPYLQNLAREQRQRTVEVALRLSEETITNYEEAERAIDEFIRRENVPDRLNRNKTFPQFGRLPHELQDTIIRWALEPGTRTLKPFAVDKCPCGWCGSNLNNLILPATPGLFLVNKHFSEEALRLTYEHHNFHFTELNIFSRFCDSIGQSNLNRIKALTFEDFITYSSGSENSVQALIKHMNSIRMPNLEKLSVRFADHTIVSQVTPCCQFCYFKYCVWLISGVTMEAYYRLDNDKPVIIEFLGCNPITEDQMSILKEAVEKRPLAWDNTVYYRRWGGGIVRSAWKGAAEERLLAWESSGYHRTRDMGNVCPQKSQGLKLVVLESRWSISTTMIY
jgi:hypothetical protein